MNDVRLILGDCLEYMRGLDAGSVDAVITDPPYGIGVTKMTLGNGAKEIYRGQVAWDEKISDAYFYEIIRIAKTVIVWGGNYYTNILPPSRCWVVWDKHTGDNSFADCELAWTNIDSVVKKVDRAWVGANAKDTLTRVHPTQKPISLMKWCVEFSKSNTIFDPFMGSGTTGVACMQLGRNFIGCEIDPTYFAIAEKRIKAAQAQEIMF